MRTCSQALRHKLKNVVVPAPQTEERRGTCTWRTVNNKVATQNAQFFPRVVADSELFRCLHNLAPQAEERRGETRVGASSELVPQAEEREVELNAEPRTTS